MLNPTQPIITPPRVPLVDPRTGLIDRAWYLFFLSLNRAVTGVIDESGVTFSAESTIASVEAELQTLAHEVVVADGHLADGEAALVNTLWSRWHSRHINISTGDGIA